MWLMELEMASDWASTGAGPVKAQYVFSGGTPEGDIGVPRVSVGKVGYWVLWIQVSSPMFTVVSTPGKWRPIVDLSSPEGRGVNDGVSIPRCSLAYVRVEDAVQGVAAMGRGSLMAKVDICQAYRAIPVICWE